MSPTSEPDSGASPGMEQAARRPIASVIGSGDAGEDARQMARDLGRCLTDAGFRVLTGGLGGVMEAASEGARMSARYRDGDVIGLLPGYEANAANPFVDIAICTGLAHARNVLCAAAGDVVIAVGGSSGTLSEIALAWTLGKPVACAGQTEGWARRLTRRAAGNFPGPYVDGPFSPEEAAAWALRQIQDRASVSAEM